MTVCNWVLTPIVVAVRTVLRVVREVVRTVCEAVSTTITTLKTVVERVCEWLPWPLSTLCNLVVRVIEVVETVWEWVCEEVIERVIRWVEVFFEYVFYVLQWVCWLLDWPLRAIGLALCALGVRPRRFMRVCVKVLTAADGTAALSTEEVNRRMQDAASIFATCNISMIVTRVELVQREEFLRGTSCEFGGMFTPFFQWFSANADRGCVTVYFVDDIQGASGCAYPGTNWVTVDDDGDGTVVVQEIGHLADLWAHSSDPDNVMTDEPAADGTHDQLTRWQCCMIRTSRFVSSVGPMEAIGLDRAARAAAVVVPLEAGAARTRRPRGG